MACKTAKAYTYNRVWKLAVIPEDIKKVNLWHTTKEERVSWTRDIQGICQTTVTHHLHYRCHKTAQRLSPYNKDMGVSSYNKSKLEESTIANT